MHLPLEEEDFLEGDLTRLFEEDKIQLEINPGKTFSYLSNDQINQPFEEDSNQTPTKLNLPIFSEISYSRRRLKRLKQNHYQVETTPLPNIVIDCSFIQHQSEKELKHLTQQFMFAYGALCNPQNPQDKQTSCHTSISPHKTYQLSEQYEQTQSTKTQQDIFFHTLINSPRNNTKYYSSTEKENNTSNPIYNNDHQPTSNSTINGITPNILFKTANSLSITKRYIRDNRQLEIKSTQYRDLENSISPKLNTQQEAQQTLHISTHRDTLQETLTHDIHPHNLSHITLPNDHPQSRNIFTIENQESPSNLKPPTFKHGSSSQDSQQSQHLQITNFKEKKELNKNYKLHNVYTGDEVVHTEKKDLSTGYLNTHPLDEGLNIREGILLKENQSVCDEESAALLMCFSNMNERLVGSIERIKGWRRWLCLFEERGWEEIYLSENIIYLTADAEDVMTTFDINTIYIIGGMVDRNRLKNITYYKAKQLDVRTQRLPIKEYIHNMKGSPVLTVNQIVHILSLLHKGYDWPTALSIIPQRKLTSHS